MAKSEPRRDPVRERRITWDVIVDAYDSDERAMGWYYYLEGALRFPFAATCIVRRAISPLRVGEKVEVIGMPPEDECEHEMFVTTRWGEGGLAVPLAQLKPVRATDERTAQAVGDWHYWVRMKYEF